MLSHPNGSGWACVSVCLPFPGSVSHVNKDAEPHELLCT
jgi:hypothetical protein